MATRRCGIALVLALLAAAALGDSAVERHIAGETICATESLRLFYERRNDTLAWFDGDRLRPDVQELITAIERSAGDGLTPSDYHLAAIRTLVAAPTASQRDLDLLLSDAFVLLASHLLGGRVDPETVEPTWCFPPAKFDVAAALQTALDEHTVGDTLARLAPAQFGYRRLREELARLRATRAWGHIDNEKRIDQIAARFGIPLPPPPARVREAVVAFQQQHGLAEDGKVGPRTLRELNVPLADRIRQVEINMERWRWLPETLGGRYGLLNIPEFRFRVVENDTEVLSMRVVVGKDYQRTPIFSSSIIQVIFSPYWNVPASIAWKEIWPKVSRDGGYLAREHMEVVDGGRIRQLPGPWNALGGIKFNIPNRFGVYLHDTPSRTLFGEPVRTFSHGCIRIQKPVELAEYLLRDNPDWPHDKIIEKSECGTECAVDVKQPLPVHVLYWTAFIGEDDILHFAPDVYHRDATLDAAMRRMPQ